MEAVYEPAMADAQCVTWSPLVGMARMFLVHIDA